MLQFKNKILILSCIALMSEGLYAYEASDDNSSNDTGFSKNTAIGKNAYAKTYNNKYGSTAIGNEANATGNSALAIGSNAEATGQWNTTAVGASAKATANNATAFGTRAEASGETSMALGFDSNASGKGAVAIGGLIVGTFLTLVFIPLVFVWSYRGNS